MNQSTSTVSPEFSAGQLVFQVASGYMASAALQVAMRLDIAARLSTARARSLIWRARPKCRPMAFIAY